MQTKFIKKSQKNKPFFRFAFTIAEVLIVLGIVGIVAEMALPSLIQKTDNMTNATAFKKTYAALTNLYQQLVAENGDIISAIGQNATSSTDSAGLAKMFMDKMKVAKDCGLASAKDKNCFAYKVKYRLLDGTPQGWENAGLTYYTFTTADGVAYMVANPVLDCSFAAGVGPPVNKLCGSITIDVNGPKGPNQYGRDTFELFLTLTGIFPRGVGDIHDYGNPNCTSNGMACGYKILMEGAMNY